jgi:hypothetical protein
MVIEPAVTRPELSRRFVTLSRLLASEAPADISDGNRDGNDGSHQRPEATMNRQLLSYVQA